MTILNILAYLDNFKIVVAQLYNWLCFVGCASIDFDIGYIGGRDSGGGGGSIVIENYKPLAVWCVQLLTVSVLPC